MAGAMDFRFHRKETTASTNADARAGRPMDVFVAEYQTAGRGRLDHRWHAARGENLTFSVVLDAAGVAPAWTATLPLAVALAVVGAARTLLGHAGAALRVKWPNDVLAGGRKLCGILCELNGDCVIAGIGLNVNQTEFPPEIAERATSLALLAGAPFDREEVLGRVVESVGAYHSRWRGGGFAALRGEFEEVDCLKGGMVTVASTDTDAAPVSGVCGGVAEDGSLIVGGTRVYAGEARLLNFLV